MVSENEQQADEDLRKMDRETEKRQKERGWKEECRSP